uniref:Putative Gag-polypeptide of LTR copia-type n=1 Tax=Tanacetum cinerariifolium TaxID=118510 RepID=A0A6L2KFU5_TANCI|nr:putative Gag-polypeptide of LTR copia-type [Tanacetum cinerariifolium]
MSKGSMSNSALQTHLSLKKPKDPMKMSDNEGLNNGGFLPTPNFNRKALYSRAGEQTIVPIFINTQKAHKVWGVELHDASNSLLYVGDLKPLTKRKYLLFEALKNSTQKMDHSSMFKNTHTYHYLSMPFTGVSTDSRSPEQRLCCGGLVVDLKIVGLHLVFINVMSYEPFGSAMFNNILDAGNPLHVQNSDNSSFVIIPFKLLDTENYRIWFGVVKLALQARDKYGFVDGTCIKESYATSDVLSAQWDRCNAIVLTWIRMWFLKMFIWHWFILKKLQLCGKS